MFASKDLFFSRPSGYQISRSVRLRSGASAYFNRTPASATNQQKWTWSGWVKRGALSSSATFDLFDCQIDANNWLSFWIYQDKIGYDISWSTSVNRIFLTSSSVYRDPSAWYHMVISVDTTQATAANRILIYINGQSVALNTYAVGSGYVTQNTNLAINSTSVHSIGRRGITNDLYFDGYLTETNFIDGQQLTPSSFGSTNANGVWSPIKYAGTYGTNGFYLNFSDNSASTATTIGKDNSGNGNNWTPNNISVTAGTTYDSMLDVPTLYADGGNGRGNYAVLNPLENVNTTYMAFQNGNLRASMGTGAQTMCWSTVVMPTSKWYCEITITTVSNGTAVGISYGSNTISDGNAKGITYAFNGNKRVLTVDSAYGSTYTTGDVIGIAVDKAASTITFYKNNASQGAISDATIATQDYRAMIHNNTSSGSGLYDINFGQRPFTYTPPTGYVALNTQNLSTPTIANGAAYMAATTYTGTGASLAIANTVNATSFQPDWVWVKGRSGATDHALYDSVRGTTKDLISNTAAAETTQATGLTAFGSTGFTVGALAKMNTNAATYVGWQWKAGTTSASNTNGTITSTVSVGATQGFSVVTYTGNGTNPGATIGHGLGVAPSFIVTKSRSGLGEWPSYHVSVGVTNTVYLNATYASGTYLNRFSAVSSSTFTTGSSGSELNTNGVTYVAYCFSEVTGYSKFGSYTGNGSADGPFVYTGFRPRWIMIKESSGTNAATSSWIIQDTSVNTYNQEINVLSAQSSSAEFSSSLYGFDGLSNGFKLRSLNQNWNESGGTYIFAAFAENPFKYSLAR
jgi:hypothetical protein